jgi:hypothetical protein
MDNSVSHQYDSLDAQAIFIRQEKSPLFDQIPVDQYPMTSAESFDLFGFRLT